MYQVEHTSRGGDTIPRTDAARWVPLSSWQRRIWLTHQLEGSSTEYNMLWAQRIRGNLNIDALSQALTVIVRRHEPLRIQLSMRNEAPVQSVRSAEEPYLIVEDLSAFQPATQQARINSAVWQEANTPFDLARGPMIRTRLLICGREDYLWIRVVHHISYDGWSDGIFCRELQLLYEAFSQGLPSPLSPLSMEYTRFAEFEQETTAALDKGLPYWRRQLKGIPPRLEVPTDPPPDTGVSASCGLHYSNLDSDELARIKQFSRANGVTLFMTMFAAFGVLMARYSGQNDIVVGSPIANRRSRVHEGMIGCFFNLLALRLKIEPGMRFAELLRQVRETTLSAYEHQDVPFDRIVQELTPHRVTERLPVFQVAFSMQDNAWAPLQLSGLDVGPPFRAEKTRSRSDLELQVSLRPGEPPLCWFFNKGLFQERRIIQMGRHYLQLLRSLITDANTEIASARMLEDSDYALLDAFNATHHSLDGTTVPALFEKQVAKTPDVTALISGEQHFSYSEINERSDRAAQFLMAQGIGTEDVVAIATDRSADLITAILGTIKAGAAYLPLDPELPTARIALILEDARPRCLLTNSRASSSLPALKDALSIYDVSECADSATGRSHNSDPAWQRKPVTADNPVYVIYTSGSTGAPKAVVGLQGGLANRIGWMRDTFPFYPGERILARTSVNFIDGSSELLTALCSGATVVLADSATAKDPAAMISTIASARISRVTVVPSLLWALLEEPGPDRLSSCKLWICSGAAIPERSVRRFYELLPDSRLLNLYGCTECSGDSTFSECQGRNVAAGRPIWNTQVYVVSESMQLNPVGVTGELYIGGTGVAREYLYRSELTAERFIPNPFVLSMDRIYRTGDLARWRPDGTIDLLGRTDRQIKIRGQRLELEEVEASLRNLPSVLEAVVVAEASATGEPQLIAFVVPAGQRELGTHALRRELLRVLPEYMIPSVFHLTSSIPVLINGKPDRHALVNLKHEDPRGHRAPLSEQEVALCALFREVLNVEKVGINDDFFEMGGHSLSAARLINRLREKFGIDLTLRTLFETGTVASLSDKYHDILAVFRNADRRPDQRARGETVPELP